MPLVVHWLAPLLFAEKVSVLVVGSEVILIPLPDAMFIVSVLLLAERFILPTLIVLKIF